MAETIKKTPAVSTSKIKNPASAGPATLVRFMLELLSDIAFINLSSGTMSEIITCLLGIFTAIKEPLKTPIIIM